jgi:hypothetical protein
MNYFWIFNRDPTEITRDSLVETLERMRKNFAHKCRPHDDDDMHSVPIQDMGNYHEYLKNQAQPLRELEAQLVRQHMFGNPFKLVSKDQKNSMGGMFGADEIDEIHEESAENSNNTTSGSNNQKSSQQQQQLLLQQQQQQTRRGVRQRRSVKGPLSKRINYLKSLYTQNSNTSGSASTISDSDIEIMDDISSMASDNTGSQFTSLTGDNNSIANSDNNSDKSLIDSNFSRNEPDVGNLNDFNDLDVEMQQQQQQLEVNELNDEVIEINQNENKLLSVVDMNGNETLGDNLRPISVASGAFSSPSELLLDANSLLTGMSGCSSALCDNYLEQSYIQLKVLCMEQIKKPGKEYSRLFQLIQESPLTVRLRYFLLRELAHEASRFKRFSLVQLLSKYAGLLQQLANATVSNMSSTSNSQAVKTE